MINTSKNVIEIIEIAFVNAVKTCIACMCSSVWFEDLCENLIGLQALSLGVGAPRQLKWTNSLFFYTEELTK